MSHWYCALVLRYSTASSFNVLLDLFKPGTSWSSCRPLASLAYSHSLSPKPEAPSKCVASIPKTHVVVGPDSREWGVRQPGRLAVIHLSVHHVILKPSNHHDGCSKRATPLATPCISLQSPRFITASNQNPSAHRCTFRHLFLAECFVTESTLCQPHPSAHCHQSSVLVPYAPRLFAGPVLRQRTP